MKTKPAPFDKLSASLTETPFCVVVSGRDHYFGSVGLARAFQRREGGDGYEINRETGEWKETEFNVRHLTGDSVMDQQVQLMQNHFPEIFGMNQEVTSLERSAAAAAAAYLMRHYQQVEGGQTGTDKIASDVADVCDVLQQWVRRSALEDNFTANHPMVPD